MNEGVDNNNNIVTSSAMLLSFEGWIKFVEGFCRGLQSTKTVDSGIVFDCIGEIMEYMKNLKVQLISLLTECENILQYKEETEEKINQIESNCNQLIDENKQLNEELEKLKEENKKLVEGVKTLNNEKKF